MWQVVLFVLQYYACTQVGKFNLGLNNAGCNAFFNNEDAVVAKSSKVKDRDSAEAPKVALMKMPWTLHYNVGGKKSISFIGKKMFGDDNRVIKVFNVQKKLRFFHYLIY